MMHDPEPRRLIQPRRKCIDHRPHIWPMPDPESGYVLHCKRGCGLLALMDQARHGEIQGYLSQPWTIHKLLIALKSGPESFCQLPGPIHGIAALALMLRWSMLANSERFHRGEGVVDSLLVRHEDGAEHRMIFDWQFEAASTYWRAAEYPSDSLVTVRRVFNVAEDTRQQIAELEASQETFPPGIDTAPARENEIG